MKKKNMRRVIVMASCIMTLLVSSSALCFADEATTPVHIEDIDSSQKAVFLMRK